MAKLKDAKTSPDYLREQMSDFANELVGAGRRLPTNMLPEKLDCFKAVSGFLNIMNRAPDKDEGNEIDQWRKALSGPAGGADSARGGAILARNDDNGDEPDGDGDDVADSEVPSGPAPVPGPRTTPAEPAASISGARNGAVGEDHGPPSSAVRHSVRWDGSA